MKNHRIEFFEKNTLKRVLLSRDGNECWICGFEMKLKSHSFGGDSLKSSIDHIDPAGSNEATNLKLAHRVCNMVRDRHQVTPPIQQACKILVQELMKQEANNVR